jgi:hypothetical protein
MTTTPSLPPFDQKAAAMSLVALLGLVLAVSVGTGAGIVVRRHWQSVEISGARLVVYATHVVRLTANDRTRPMFLLVSHSSYLLCFSALSTQ